jgi:DNA-binding XRE family transcriptional regulator
MRDELQAVIIIAVVGIIKLALLALFVYLAVLIIRALRKYLKSAPVREEKREYKKSLGEVLKTHRTSCHMTQEFVAESIGVTRQAVSKWENGTADPSTSNLLALAKLYGVSAEELLHQVGPESGEAKP